MKNIIPIVIIIGWFNVVIWVPIIAIVWVLVTIDMVQPWDIVIDDNTKEIARWGEYYDHP